MTKTISCPSAEDRESIRESMVRSNTSTPAEECLSSSSLREAREGRFRRRLSSLEHMSRKESFGSAAEDCLSNSSCEGPEDRLSFVSVNTAKESRRSSAVQRTGSCRVGTKALAQSDIFNDDDIFDIEDKVNHGGKSSKELDDEFSQLLGDWRDPEPKRQPRARDDLVEARLNARSDINYSSKVLLYQDVQEKLNASVPEEYRGSSGESSLTKVREQDVEVSMKRVQAKLGALMGLRSHFLDGNMRQEDWLQHSDRKCLD